MSNLMIKKEYDKKVIQVHCVAKNKRFLKDETRIVQNKLKYKNK